MKTYEFSTCITDDHKLVIPEVYTPELPKGQTVRVIILVNEKLSPDEDEYKKEELLSLETVIAQIKNTSQNPNNIQQGSGLLAEYLMNSSESPDPSFDVNK